MLGQAEVLPEVLPNSAPVSGVVLPEGVTSSDHEILPVNRLLNIIEKQAHELQGAHWRNGHLETRVQDLETLVSKQEQHLKLLTDSQHKPNLWRRTWQWFIGTPR